MGGGSWVSGGATSAAQVPSDGVTFAPGGVAALGVYPAWSDLYAATSALTGPLRVFFDCKLAPTPGTCSIPAGAYAFASPYLSFEGGQLITQPNTTFTATRVDFAQGATLSRLRMARNVVVQTSSTVAPITIPAGSGVVTFEMYGASAILANSTAPVILYASGAGTNDIILYNLYNRSNIAGATGGGTSSLKLTGPGTIIIQSFGANILGANSIGAPTAAQVIVEYTEDTTVNTGQVGILDTSSFGSPVLFSRASGSGYSNAGYAGVTTVSGALDAIQTRTVGLQGGTSSLTNGVSGAISATLTASSVIQVTRKDVNGSITAIGALEVKAADRTVGAPGSFLVTSIGLATLATVVTDQSTFDWVVLK